ncbi:hypothetical protein Tco_1368236 [Tanacetum coccineum]
MEAYDGEINLGVEENMISNEYEVKLCLEHEVKRGNKIVKKELIVALRAGGGKLITIYPDIDPFLEDTEEEDKSMDDWDQLLDFNLDDIPLLGGEELPPFVCKIGKSSRNKKRAMENLNLFYQDIGTSSFTWETFDQERSSKEALALRISQKPEEGMGILTNVLCQVKVTTLIAKFLILDIPIDHDAPIVVGQGLLRTIGGIVNTPERLFSTFDGFCDQTFRAARSNVMRNAESDSDDKEEYEIKRNKFGAPIYGPKPAPYLNCNDPADRSLALQTETNPFWKISVWKKAGRVILRSADGLMSRVVIPRPSSSIIVRTLYDRMGSMEIRQEAIERMNYRQSYQWDRDKNDRKGLNDAKNYVTCTNGLMDPNSSLGKICLGENVVEISSDKIEGSEDWDSPEYQDTANSGGKKETKAMVFHKMDTEEISDRFVAPCFVNGMEAYDGEINLGVEENGEIYFVKFIINPEEDDVEPGVIFGRSFLRMTKAITDFEAGTITIYPDIDPFLEDTEEEDKSMDDWDQLLDFNLDDIPLLGGEELPPFVCKIGKSSRNKKRAMENLNLFYQDIGTSSSTGRHLTQEEAAKEALALRISQKFALLEEVDKVELDGMIVKEEEEAIKKVNGEALKGKDDPGAFIFPIRLEGQVNKNALADTGSDINTMPYQIYEQLGREDMKKVDRRITMINHTQAEGMGILTNVLCQVKVTTLIAKFLILDIPIDRDAPIVGRVIPEDPQPGVSRVGIPRPLRASMQDLYDRMGSMEIRQEAIERMNYRQSYQWDRYQGVFEHMAGVYSVPLQRAYNPPGYAQPQYDQYYQQYPPPPPQYPPQYQQQQDDDE